MLIFLYPCFFCYKWSVLTLSIVIPLRECSEDLSLIGAKILCIVQQYISTYYS